MPIYAKPYEAWVDSETLVHGFYREPRGYPVRVTSPGCLDLYGDFEHERAPHVHRLIRSDVSWVTCTECRSSCHLLPWEDRAVSDKVYFPAYGDVVRVSDWSGIESPKYTLAIDYLSKPLYRYVTYYNGMTLAQREEARDLGAFIRTLKRIVEAAVPGVGEYGEVLFDALVEDNGVAAIRRLFNYPGSGVYFAAAGIVALASIGNSARPVALPQAFIVRYLGAIK